MAESEKILHMIKITTPDPRAFNIFWAKESLPQWIKRGAKHVGSYVYKVGGPTNVIIRLFEWESLEQWENWNKWLFGSQEGKDLLAKIAEYSVLTEAYLLTPAPTA